ncbi:MAG: PorP/SprF family type IX secretion system membrane protein [Paludibacter sp.]|nr:PorP/SprF family type IX secretion system membrane protein [Paludibacter sp.]
MNRLILFFFITIGTTLSTKALAQADISMATEWYNRANYNPASIAKPDYIYLFSNVRRQWIGIDGAPTVFNVQASEYIHELHSAFGISLVSDHIGATQAINPMLTYAYRITADLDWSFSMGLSIGAFSRYIDGSLFQAENISDPALYNGIERVLQPDANIGIEFQNKHFVLGVSSTHLFSYVKDSTLFLNTNHRYGYAIYKNTDSELLNYNFGLQVVNRVNLTVLEGNASIRFKHATGLNSGPREIFDLGITYRTSQQMTFLVGLNITPNFRVGYAYDQSFITGYTQNGSHEIMLEYRIPSKAASTCIQCQNNDYWYY